MLICGESNQNRTKRKAGERENTGREGAQESTWKTLPGGRYPWPLGSVGTMPAACDGLANICDDRRAKLLGTSVEESLGKLTELKRPPPRAWEAAFPKPGLGSPKGKELRTSLCFLTTDGM